MSKMMKLIILICVCVTGTSNLVYAAENPLLSQLPAAVQEVVKRELAGVQITEVDDDDYDGIEVYKIEAETADGKELMIKVGPDGTLYQKEVEIGLQEVPKAVLAVFRKELGNADDDVDEVKRISKQGRIQYNIEAEIGGKDVELKIAADGTLLEKDVDEDNDDDEDGNAGGVIAGILFDSMDFTNPRSGLDVLPSLDMSWGADRGKGWSARWIGGINGPYFGDVTFTVETNGKVRVTVAGYIVIDTLTKAGPLTGATRMAKDGGDWIQIEYVAIESPAYMRIYWQWPGQPKAIVFNDELDYDEDDIPGYGVEDQRRDDEDDKVSPLLPRFTGGQPSVVNLEYHDGRVRPVVGSHSFQVMRSNRTHPELAVKDVPYYPEDGYEKIGFMYNHAPMLCYWKDMFWLFYRSGPTNEHEEPCYNLITWSKDGRNWEKPQTIFPAKRFRNRSKNNKVQYSIAHQRMAFYVTKDGRLLVSGFYGMPPTPNGGNGVGRAIREIYGPGKYGPIHWVRLNSHQRYNKDNAPHFPFYRKATDAGFVKAVDELLANNLVVQQWYEEERDDAGKTCAFVPGEDDDFDAKAFNWYTLPDGKIVGMWKGRWMALADKWERGHFKAVGHGRDIYYSGAKIWGQRTSDGRYALVYNPVLQGRHPLSVITSDNGLDFNAYFLNAHAEAPPARFGGHSKDGGGSGYIRGIIPGNGTPPGTAMWLTYSCNKEDIWVSRVPVPITGAVEKDVVDGFEDMKPGQVVTGWNILSGIWTPVTVVTDKGNKVLRLQDKDPYEYAKAVRVFPEATLTNLLFKLHPHQKTKGGIEIEVLNYKGQRPVRIKIEAGRIKANKGAELTDIGAFAASKWLKFDISVDTVTGVYDLKLNGKAVVSDAAFAEALTFADKPYPSRFRVPTVERIEFRTGAYRMMDFSRYGAGENGCLKGGGDLPGADHAVENAIFDIDDVRTSGVKP
ncbi:MAG: hypothetical protein ACYTBJ_10710 [Planctomycetota bacterium]|jgi:hypothetical protein